MGIEESATAMARAMDALDRGATAVLPLQPPEPHSNASLPTLPSPPVLPLLPPPPFIPSDVPAPDPPDPAPPPLTAGTKSQAESSAPTATPAQSGGCSNRGRDPDRASIPMPDATANPADTSEPAP